MKRIISITLFIALASFAGAAQTAAVTSAAPAVSVPAAEFKVFSMEASVLVGYDLAAADVAGGAGFAFNLIMADSMSVGIQTAGIGGTYNTLKLSYYLNPSIGFSAHMGTNVLLASPAAGLGAFFNVGKSNPANGLVSGYKIKADYFFPTDDIAGGVFAVSAALSLGI